MSFQLANLSLSFNEANAWSRPKSAHAVPTRKVVRLTKAKMHVMVDMLPMRIFDILVFQNNIFGAS